jgi:hypothetical protein
MTENMAGGSQAPLFFPGSVPSAVPEPTAAFDPANGPAGIQVDAATIWAMGEPDLRYQILQMLACLRRCPMEEIEAGEKHADGTLELASMVAVWIVATIGKAFGRKLVRLSDVDPESLHSVGGVASLITKSVATIALARAA